MERAGACVLLGCLLVSWTPGGLTAAAGSRDAPAEVAIIVHPDNHTPDPSLQDLRAILTLQRQFWSDGRRIVILLPATGSVERQVLLRTIYRLTDSDLRRLWARRLFAGEISAIPLTVRASEASVAGVKESPGAIAAVPAGDVPTGVRVLLINGKRPGDSGYPLTLEEKP